MSAKVGMLIDGGAVSAGIRFKTQDLCRSFSLFYSAVSTQRFAPPLGGSIFHSFCIPSVATRSISALK